MKKTMFLTLLTTVSLFAKPVVTTSILPTKYFVEQIAGDTLSVNAMVERGSDPHTYEPKPKQMKELEKSEIYFAIGIEFEDTWLKRFEKNYPNLKIVRTDEGIKKIYMDGHSHDHHDHEEHKHDDHNDKKADKHHEHKHEADHKHEKTSHDKEHKHSGCSHNHGSLDPHVWLDPMLVKKQAKIIAQNLIEKFPENKALYEENLGKFLTKLDDLHKFIEGKLANFKDAKFIVYHPSWGYFAKRYDLEQIAIEVEGKEPKPQELAELIEEAKEHKIKVIFVAPQFSKKSANIIAKQTGASVVEIDQLPLDWDAEMRKTAEIFANSLK